jgi:hypothetical protein
LPNAITEPLNVIAPTNCADEQFDPVAVWQEAGNTLFRAKTEGCRFRHHGIRDTHSRHTDQRVHGCHEFRHLGHLDARGHECTDPSADHQRNEHQRQTQRQVRTERSGLLRDQRDGREYRDRHADHAEHVPGSGRLRIGQPLERLDEADGGDQIEERNDVHAHLRPLLG